MKKLCMMLLLAFGINLLCVGSAAWAKNVTVTGAGATQAEAENDALRRAVENTLGVLVDSQTLVEKNVVLQDEIYTQSKGFITDYKVREKKQSSLGWSVTIDATVDDAPNSRLMNELTRLGLIDRVLRNPKIAVMIPEQHIAYRVPDPAGETAVVKKFLAAGFTNMVDISKERLQYNNPYNLNDDDMQNLASSLQADILVVGQAFSEGAGDVSRFINGAKGNTGVVSCRARIEAKMYIARTGQIIAADGKYGSGVDISEAVAAKKALAAAGESLGDYLVDALLSTDINRKGMELVVIGGDFSKINEIKTALSGISGVKNAVLSGYANGRGTFSVQYSGAPETLFRQLSEAAECSLEMRSVSYNVLTVAAY